MKIYWSWKSVPEFAGLTRAEVKRIATPHRFRFLKDRRYWIVTMLFMILFGFVMANTPESLPDIGWWRHLIYPGIPCGILGCIYGIAISQIQLRAMLPHIRQEMATGDLNRQRE